MIVIFTNHNDQSTNKIIEWLCYYNAKFIRINDSDNPENLAHLILERNGEISTKFNFSNFQKTDKAGFVTFFRRGEINSGFNVGDNYGVFNSILNKHLKSERGDLNIFLMENLQLNELNSPRNYRVNKLKTLKIATKFGIKIPKTMITNNKSALLEKMGLINLICKPLTDNLIIDYGSFKSSHSPKILTKKEIQTLPLNFGYTLFQELINVVWEIRAFVFGDIIRAVAVVANTSDTNTYNSSNSLFNKTGHFKRIFPIELPKKIKEKIIKFMGEMKLFTGSLDILYSNDNNFYFLEVNPVGQFDYVSYFGNFNLYKLTAEKLIEYHEKKN